MIIISKWFINFNDNLTDLTFHSSSNFYYQIVSAQSIQRNKLCLTSLMSMNSGIMKMHYVQYGINASGEPTSQVITNWDATRGTPLGQRGATRDKSPETEVKIGSTITEFP